VTNASATLRYLLDTNTCIRYLNGRAPQVRTRLEATPREQVVVCSVVKAEMLAGARRSTDVEHSLQRQRAFFARFVSLPFDDAAAERYSSLRAHLLNAGTPIGPHDMLIAAIALANGLALVTHNTDEFRRVPELVLEDWEV
jgi:tRNA(fMet)-specific endonuclease VapC